MYWVLSTYAPSVKSSLPDGASAGVPTSTSAQ
jgi:hypothetical protein